MSDYLERPRFTAELTVDIDDRDEHDQLDDELMIRRIRRAIINHGAADLAFEVEYEDGEGVERTVSCRLDFASLVWIDPEKE